MFQSKTPWILAFKVFRPISIKQNRVLRVAYTPPSSYFVIYFLLLLLLLCYLNIQNNFSDFGCYTQFYWNLSYDCTAMKMEALLFFGTVLTTYKSTLCKIPELRERWKNCTYPRHEGVRRSRSVHPLLLNFYTGWKWVVNLRPQPKNPHYVLSKSLGGPQGQYGRFGRKKINSGRLNLGSENCSENAPVRPRSLWFPLADTVNIASVKLFQALFS